MQCLFVVAGLKSNEDDLLVDLLYYLSMVTTLLQKILLYQELKDMNYHIGNDLHM